MSSSAKDYISLNLEKSTTTESKKPSNYTIRRRIRQWSTGLKLSKIERYFFYFSVVAICCFLLFLIYHKITYYKEPSSKIQNSGPNMITRNSQHINNLIRNKKYTSYNEFRRNEL